MTHEQYIKLHNITELIREKTNDIDYSWIPQMINDVTTLKKDMQQEYVTLTPEQLSTEEGWLMGERITALQTIAVWLNDLHNSLDKLDTAVGDME